VGGVGGGWERIRGVRFPPLMKTRAKGTTLTPYSEKRRDLGGTRRPKKIRKKVRAKRGTFRGE